MTSSLRTQTYFRLSFLSAENNTERNDSRKYVCVRRLDDKGVVAVCEVLGGLSEEPPEETRWSVDSGSTT